MPIICVFHDLTALLFRPVKVKKVKKPSVGDEAPPTAEIKHEGEMFKGI